MPRLDAPWSAPCSPPRCPRCAAAPRSCSRPGGTRPAARARPPAAAPRAGRGGDAPPGATSPAASSSASASSALRAPDDCQRASRSASRTNVGCVVRRGRPSPESMVDGSSMTGADRIGRQVGVEARIGEVRALAAIGAAQARSGRRSRCGAACRRSARRCGRRATGSAGRRVGSSLGGIGRQRRRRHGAARDHSGGESRSRSNRPSSALKTSSQRPQRTQPSDTLSWSCTTRNTVPQEVHRVARLMPESCHAACGRARSSAPSRRRRRTPASASQGA